MSTLLLYRRYLLLLAFATAITILLPAPSYGWWAQSHHRLTTAAITLLPQDMPAFFRKNSAATAHCAMDPDVSKHPGARFARDAEHPEHYFDLEFLDTNRIPASRTELIALSCSLGIPATTIGFLPYAVLEYTDRLATAFAEYRRWPRDPAIAAKCHVYAGFLAHYAQDLCQPLHLTRYFDGKATADGTLLYSGIHEAVDALVERLVIDPAAECRNCTAEPLVAVKDTIFERVRSGNALVDSVYTLAPDIMRTKDTAATEPVLAFSRDRVRDAVILTAALYRTAWQASENITFESWLDRNLPHQSGRTR